MKVRQASLNVLDAALRRALAEQPRRSELDPLVLGVAVVVYEPVRAADGSYLPGKIVGRACGMRYVDGLYDSRSGKSARTALLRTEALRGLLAAVRKEAKRRCTSTWWTV